MCYQEAAPNDGPPVGLIKLIIIEFELKKTPQSSRVILHVVCSLYVSQLAKIGYCKAIFGERFG